MKEIFIQRLKGLKTTDVIRGVVERPPQGAGLDAVRAGCRVLDVLDKLPEDKETDVGGSFSLEDADHQFVVDALRNYRFAMISKDLLAIVDGVMNAAAPEVSSRAARG